jgi:hypothetical protein
MTVTSDTVALYTPYVQGTTKKAPFTYTSGQLSAFLLTATEKFQKDDPGFANAGKPDLIDQAIVYLIADSIWWSFNGFNENTSERSGDMSRSRNIKNGDFVSPWMGKYESLLKTELVAPTSGVLRSDVTFNRGVKLSDLANPRPAMGDPNLVQPTAREGL